MSAQRTLARPVYPPDTGDPWILAQFLLLSMLLHLLVIVLFGTVSGNAIRRSDGLLDSLEVTLRRASTDRSAGSTIASPAAIIPHPSDPTNASGVASPLEKRSEKPTDTDDDARTSPAPDASETPRAVESAPAPPPPAETLPRLNPDAREQVDKAYRPAPPSTPKITPFEPRPLANIPSPSIARELAPSLPLSPTTVPVTPTPIERILPPVIDQDLAPSVQLAPRIAPVLPTPIGRLAPRVLERDLAPPMEVAPREAPIAPAPIERIAPRELERNLAPPIEVTPREAPIAPAPIERIAPRQVEQTLAPPVALTPREAPIAPAPIERIAPRQVERDLAPPVELSPREVLVVPPSFERMAPPSNERDLAPTTTLTAPTAIPAPGDNAPQRAIDAGSQLAPAARPDVPQANVPDRFHFGSPTPEEEVFKPRGGVMPSAAEPGGQPYLDVQAARSRAVREIAAGASGSRAIVQIAPPLPPEFQSKDARAIEKALKPDCRTAYAGLGLLAIPVLVASALAESGCRW